jgi:hypothetical protein
MKAISGAIIGSLIFIVIAIVIISIFSFIKIDNIQSDYNTKMKDIVDQINAAQYYEYKFDKNNKSKINVLHNDVTNKFTSYDKDLDSLKKKNILLDNSFINNGKQIRGYDWVTAGSNNSSWMNSSGEIRGNSWVGVGSNNSSWMNNAGEIRGNSWVAAGSNNASWMNNAGQIYANNSVKSGGSIELNNQSAYMRNGELYAKNKLKVDGTGEIGNLTVNGTTTMTGDLNTRHGHTINSAGRQHIFGNEHLYLLNKTGVTVSKAWRGNGNLTTEGDLNTQGNLSIQNNIILKAHDDGWYNNITKKNDLVIVNTSENLNSTAQPKNGITLAPWNAIGGLRAHGSGVDVNGNLKTNVLQIGNKWRLADVDAHGNNAWLRLHNVQDGLNSTGYDNYKLKSGASETGQFGGIAAGQYWSATGSYHSGSDIRLKDNVKYISENEILNLDKLKPVKYNLKSDPDKKLYYGLVAQDIEKIYPNLVTEGPDGIKSVNYQGLIPLMLNKLQTMSDQIEQVKK